MIHLEVTDAFRQGLTGAARPKYRDPWESYGAKAPVWAQAAWLGKPYLNPGSGVLVPGTVTLQDDGHEIAAVGGKGSAKTFTGGMRASRIIQRWPGTKGFIVANSYAQAYGSAGVKLVEISAGLSLEFFHRTEMTIDGIKHYNVYVYPAYDCFVCVLSFDNISMIEGTEWDWGWVEEVQDCERTAVETAVSRIRRGKGDHSVYYAGMPDDVNHWMYGYFEENGIPLYEPPLKENEHNLPENYMTRMRRYHGADFDRYVEGKRISLFRTPALRSLRWEIHVRSDDNPSVDSLGHLARYDERLPLYLTWDFNVNPLCVSAWQLKTHTFDVSSASRLSCPACGRELVWSNLFQGMGCSEHGHVPNPDTSRVGKVRKELLVQVDEWEMFGGNTEKMCEVILGDYGGHKRGGLVIGDSTGSKTSTNTREPGRTDWTIIQRMLGKLPGMVVRPGVLRSRKPAGTRRKVGERKVTYSNPAVRDRVTVLDNYLIDDDGHPRIIFLPESNYPSGGAAKSCQSARWKGDGKIDDANDKLPPTERAAPRTHYFDGVGYLVFHLTGGKVEVDGGSGTPDLSRARLTRRMRFSGRGM